MKMKHVQDTDIINGFCLIMFLTATIVALT
jgi:hypothetical protein